MERINYSRESIILEKNDKFIYCEHIIREDTKYTLVDDKIAIRKERSALQPVTGKKYDHEVCILKEVSSNPSNKNEQHKTFSIIGRICGYNAIQGCEPSLSINIDETAYSYKAELQLFIEYIFNKYQNIKHIAASVSQNGYRDNQKLNEESIKFFETIECVKINAQSLKTIRDGIINDMKEDIQDTESKIKNCKNKLKTQKQELDKYLNSLKQVKNTSQTLPNSEEEITQNENPRAIKLSEAAQLKMNNENMKSLDDF